MFSGALISLNNLANSISCSATHRYAVHISISFVTDFESREADYCYMKSYEIVRTENDAEVEYSQYLDFSLVGNRVQILALNYIISTSIT